MKTYQVGDQVWWAHCGVREVQETCAVCAGKREVTLILGDDTALTLPCEYCGCGYEGPRGYTTHHEYVAEAEHITISDISVHITPGGEAREYRGTGGWCLDLEDIFDTPEEATVRATIKAAAYAACVDERGMGRRKAGHRSYTWGAGYHMREAKRARQQLEYHEKQAQICKDRARKPAPAGSATNEEET